MEFPSLRRPMCVMLCTALLLSGISAAQGAEEIAEDISGAECLVNPEAVINAYRLFDGDLLHAAAIGESMTLSDPQGIGSAYLIFDTEPGEYTVTDSEKTISFGSYGFLHEFLDFQQAFGYAPQSVTFSFSSEAVHINELYLFTSGTVPDFVQKWKVPKEGNTDLMLFSAHGDDEHLFFAGLLPDYAGERGYETLVVYLTNHRNLGTLRSHEILNGLWAVGVTTYPIFGQFGDYYSRSKDQAYAIQESHGQSREALLGFVVEQLRRFHPQVVVGHDVNGEYGHGQHAMFSELLCQGVEAAEDPAQYPGLASRYGTWQVPKTYLHLWPEDPISLNWDHPLGCFDGMTAFQASVNLGFACHRSQIGGVTGFITNYSQAADVPSYSPCDYGLYRTTVGTDTGKQDFFEHLTSYRRQELAAASAARQQDAALFSSRTHQISREIQRQEAQKLKSGQQKCRELRGRIAVLTRQASRLRLGICLSASAAIFASAALLWLVLRKCKK